MKKKLILVIILIALSIFVKIPNYVELNNLAIIESIGIDYNNSHYTIYLKEVIPIKDDLGINYKYKYYKDDGKNIRETITKLKSKTKKKLYLDKVKFLVTNTTTSMKISKELNINFKYIYHTKNNILKKLKEI